MEYHQYTSALLMNKLLEQRLSELESLTNKYHTLFQSYLDTQLDDINENDLIETKDNDPFSDTIKNYINEHNKYLNFNNGFNTLNVNEDDGNEQYIFVSSDDKPLFINESLKKLLSNQNHSIPEEVLVDNIKPLRNSEKKELYLNVQNNGSNCPLTFHSVKISNSIHGNLELYSAEKCKKSFKKCLEKYHCLQVFHFQKIIDQFGEGVTLSDYDGLFLIFNKKMEEITGYSQQEANTNANFLQLIYPTEAIRQEVFTAINKLILHKNQQTVETQIQTKHGQQKVLIVSTAVVELFDHEFFLSVYTDITQRKYTELELHKYKNQLEKIVAERNRDLKLSEENLKTIFNSTTDGISITTEDGYFVEVNDTLCKMLKYTKKELLVLRPLDVMMLKGNITREEILAKLHKHKSILFETQNKDKHGNIIPVEIHAKLIRYSGREVVLSAIRDVSDRKKAQSAIEESNRKFKEFAELLPQTVFETDENGIFSFVNKKGLELFGYSENDFHEGVSVAQILERKELPKFHNRIHQKLSGEDLGDIEYTFMRKNGTTFPGRVYTNFKIEDNKIRSIRGVAIDISEQKKVENELKIAKNKAEESDKLKSAFLANMSHEIRTPMNSIVGFSQLLARDKLSLDKKEKYLEYINSSSKQLITIISDIIDISKLEVKQIRLNEEPFSLMKIFQELFDTYSIQKNKIEKQHIKLLKELEIGEYESIILTDAVRLKQIFSNLLNNAFKFTESGFIKFGCKFHNQTNLLFYVQDTGIGIRKEKHETIFDRFSQEDPSPSRSYGGTGLGLSISKGLVDLFGGEIWLESEKGEGTTFFFSIPYHPVVIDVDESEKTIDSPAHSFNFHNIEILIVEDVQYNVQYLLEILEDTHAKCHSVNFGKDAINFCKKNPNIDIILMDIQLPDMNGHEVTKEIKSMFPDIKVIAQTAYALSEDKRNAIKSGCDDYISKPIDDIKLLNKISILLQKRIKQ